MDVQCELLIQACGIPDTRNWLEAKDTWVSLDLGILPAAPSSEDVEFCIFSGLSDLPPR